MTILKLIDTLQLFQINPARGDLSREQKLENAFPKDLSRGVEYIIIGKGEFNLHQTRN